MLLRLLQLQLFSLASTYTALSKNQTLNTLAQTPFDCKHVQAKGFKFDLSRLPAPITISNTENTPPTRTTTSITINLCQSLEREPVPESEQCPPGTRICMKVVNEKTGKEDRLVQVIGAGGSEGSDWYWSAELGEGLEGAERALEIEMHGSHYAQHTQQTEIKFKCDRNASKDSKPTLKKYDKLDGTLKLEWITPWACATSMPGAGEGEGNNDDKDHVGIGKPTSGSSSSWGFFSWFFFLIFIGGAAYFAIGFWRNYNEYGVIELPNKDFWREAPYIAKDMGKHIYSTVSGQGSSRGAYEPV